MPIASSHTGSYHAWRTVLADKSIRGPAPCCTSKDSPSKTGATRNHDEQMAENAPITLGYGCIGAHLRASAPTADHQRLVTRHQCTDSALGNLLPTLAAVNPHQTHTPSKPLVEQHDALISPAGQVAVISQGDTQIVFKFLVNIVQQGRQRHTAVHRNDRPIALPG